MTRRVEHLDFILWCKTEREKKHAQLRREVIKAKRLRVKAVGRHVKQTERA